MAIKARQLKVGLPFGIGEITFIADEVQQRAAWELYVELSTRVTIQRLDEEHGLLREALTSLYSLFAITREILRKAGPDVADGPDSFGPIAIRVLNDGLRPFTAKWHPLLKAHESHRPEHVDPVMHERAWIVNGEDYHALMRRELEELQPKLKAYADALAVISGAKHID